ncbi:MAG: RNA methyltransferase [Desulfobacterales bacterium]
MKQLSKTRLYLALIHYPVVNKNGQIIASAVTNLDLHDIARAARTYGVSAFYVVTPLKDQQELVKRLLSHWLQGGGAQYNPVRGEALGLIRVADSLEIVKQDILRQEKEKAETVVTCAKDQPGCLHFSRFREMLDKGSPYLLIFGTAWGISRDFITAADHILEPVRGNTDYNHLSVRSAASIILDRLMGSPCTGSSVSG